MSQENAAEEKNGGEKKQLLHDRDIREPLFAFLEESLGKVRIFEEKRMGKSRADIVMVTPDALYGIEIKSDADSYARLQRQVADYDLYFDRNYVVVGTTHAYHIEEHVPEHWGIITVELQGSRLDFYILRAAATNPYMDRKKKLSILWRPELAHLQELNAMPKYAEKSKAFVIDRLIQCVPEETLAPQLCEELFERDYSRILEVINEYRIAHGQKKRRNQKRKRRKYKPI